MHHRSFYRGSRGTGRYNGNNEYWSADNCQYGEYDRTSSDSRRNSGYNYGSDHGQSSYHSNDRMRQETYPTSAQEGYRPHATYPHTHMDGAVESPYDYDYRYPYRPQYEYNEGLDYHYDPTTLGNFRSSAPVRAAYTDDYDTYRYDSGPRMNTFADGYGDPVDRSYRQGNESSVAPIQYPSATTSTLPNYNNPSTHSRPYSTEAKVYQKQPVPNPPPFSSRQHSRSPTPPPLPLSKPTQEYLSTSSKPSHTLQDPKGCRKLLILDLNGTLVYRSPRRHYAPYDPSADPTVSRPLRNAYPRPFLPSFVDYLLHASTREWLDTMVWSSAMPHSVSDMVQRCFGERKGELKAIWARDRMGLGTKEYHRKTQTTKDLAKPWAELASPPASSHSSDTDSAPSSPGSSSMLRHCSKRRQQRHSAQTTLLLDDSPRKAHLQPWNHLCIREYTSEMRSADVTVRDREISVLKALVNEEVDSHVDLRGDVVDQSEDTPLDPDSLENQKKRKRKEKKERKKAMKAGVVVQSQSEEDSAVNGFEQLRKYDITLLAVVGVLDAVKRESNVAGWVKAGGLLSFPGSVEGEDKEDSEQQISAPDAIHSDKKRRLSGGVEETPPPSSPTPPSSQTTVGPDSDTLDQVQTGVPMDGFEVDTGTDVGAHLWFEDERVLEAWSRRGINALEELEIEVVSGVVGTFG